MLDVLRFWLDRGVDGFRLDAISMLFEDKQLRHQPLTGGTNAFGDPNRSIVYTTNLPEVHEVARKMRELVDSYPGDRVLIGEVVVYSLPELTVWYGTPGREGLHLPMNFIVGFGTRDYSPALIRRFMEGSESELGKHPPLLVFDNHDQPRSIDRYGDGKHDVEIAKGIAAILLGSRGAALTYYGAELGMRTQTPERKEDVRDQIGLRGWPKDKGHDGQRTPMQWTPGPQAGFSTNSKPWLPIPSNHATINAQMQSADPNSLHNWYRTLIHLRSTLPAFRDGGTVMIDRGNPDVLAWRRGAVGAKAVVAINMTGRPATLALDDAGGTRFRTLAVSDADHTGGKYGDAASFHQLGRRRGMSATLQFIYRQFRSRWSC